MSGQSLIQNPKQLVALLAGLGVMFYFGYFYYSLATGKDRMTQICSLMVPGMTVDQLISLAKEKGLGPSMPKPDTKHTILAEARSMGRHACLVELENGIVKSATYNFAD